MAKKRHSAADMKHVQGVHDSAMSLGADCSMGNVAWPAFGEAALQEASLPMNQSHDALRGHLRGALMHAHGVTHTYDSNGPYIMDTFNKDVVYQHGGVHYQRPYSVDHTKNPPTVKLGDAKQVHRAYIPVGEASVQGQGAIVQPKESDVIITSDLIIEESTVLSEDFQFVVQEAAGASPNLIPVKLISPGWGTTGYYSTEMLKRDGPKVFTKDLHMYMNHPTAQEDKNRPERDVKDLAAVLTENAKWMDQGFDGPGLYSTFKPFSDHVNSIKEKGKYTGVSIRAYATNISEGEAEGRKGKIIEGFAKALSTDFVTRAGRDGKALVSESERTPEPPTRQESNMAMTTEETNQLREAQNLAAANKVLLDAALAESAKKTREANSAIAAAAFIEVFKAKNLNLTIEAAKAMAINPPLTEKGDVDLEAIKKIAEGFTPAKKTGTGVHGMGATTEKGEQTAQESEKELSDIFGSSSFGLTEAAAKIAAKGVI